jgi:hypothetical protein
MSFESGTNSLKEIKVRLLSCVLLTLAVGCGASVTPTSQPVDISGEVKASGKPVSGVKLNLQPTGDGLPAVIDVQDGKFTAQVIPGKYTYFISAGKDAAALKKINEKYQSGSADRQYDVGSGTQLTLALD